MSKGASLQDRATHEPNPQAVSAVPVGIPSAGDWVVVRTSSFGAFFYHDYGQVDSVKPKTVYVKVGCRRRLSRHALDNIVVVADKDEAQRMLARLESARAEANRRRRAADDAYKSEIGRIYAQAMSAGTAKTARPVEGKARQRGPKDAPVSSSIRSAMEGE